MSSYLDNVKSNNNSIPFEKIPTCSVVPVNNADLCNKEYVDGKINSASGWPLIENSFFTSSNSYSGFNVTLYAYGGVYTRVGSVADNTMVKISLTYRMLTGGSVNSSGVSVPIRLNPAVVGYPYYSGGTSYIIGSAHIYINSASTNTYTVFGGANSAPESSFFIPSGVLANNTNYQFHVTLCYMMLTTAPLPPG